MTDLIWDDGAALTRLQGEPVLGSWRNHTSAWNLNQYWLHRNHVERVGNSFSSRSHCILKINKTPSHTCTSERMGLKRWEPSRARTARRQYLATPCLSFQLYLAVKWNWQKVLILSLSLLLCRTRVGERNQWIHQSGRTTVAAGSIPALPSQQMLIE